MVAWLCVSTRGASILGTKEHLGPASSCTSAVYNIHLGQNFGIPSHYKLLQCYSYDIMLQCCRIIRFQQWKHCPVVSIAHLVGLNWQLKITTWLYGSTLHIYHIYYICREVAGNQIKTDKLPSCERSLILLAFDRGLQWEEIGHKHHQVSFYRGSATRRLVWQISSKCCRDTTAFFTVFELPWHSAQRYRLTKTDCTSDAKWVHNPVQHSQGWGNSP